MTVTGIVKDRLGNPIKDAEVKVESNQPPMGCCPAKDQVSESGLCIYRTNSKGEWNLRLGNRVLRENPEARQTCMYLVEKRGYMAKRSSFSFCYRALSKDLCPDGDITVRTEASLLVQ